MGLHYELTDISSDSLPVFLLAVIFSGVCYLRSSLSTFLHSLGQYFYYSDVVDDDMLLDAVGSGLAGLIVFTEQLKLNPSFSYKYRAADGGSGPVECVVCLNRMSEGEQMRKLGCCQHVFHKEWLDHINLNCPLWVLNERVKYTRSRMARDLLYSPCGDEVLLEKQLVEYY